MVLSNYSWHKKIEFDKVISLHLEFFTVMVILAILTLNGKKNLLEQYNIKRYEFQKIFSAQFNLMQWRELEFQSHPCLCYRICKVRLLASP
jgi:hypothetical protein